MSEEEIKDQIEDSLNETPEEVNDEPQEQDPSFDDVTDYDKFIEAYEKEYGIEENNQDPDVHMEEAI